LSNFKNESSSLCVSTLEFTFTFSNKSPFECLECYEDNEEQNYRSSVASNSPANWSQSRGRSSWQNQCDTRIVSGFSRSTAPDHEKGNHQPNDSRNASRPSLSVFSVRMNWCWFTNEIILCLLLLLASLRCKFVSVSHAPNRLFFPTRFWLARMDVELPPGAHLGVEKAQGNESPLVISKIKKE
jgi:hypothetical protein